jgi:hypothetical protein
MKLRSAIMLVALSTISQAALAADSLSAHSWAILLRFDGTDFTGFGGRLCLSPKTNFDVLLGVNANTERTEHSIFLHYDPPRREGSTALSLRLGIEHHVFSIDRLSFYGAIAVSGSYTRSHNEYLDNKTSSSIFRTLNTYLGFGAEYLLTDRLALSGQTLAYWSGAHDTYNQSDGDVQTSYSSEIRAGESTLTLIFYF